ncbi:MAG: hypothetical protein WKH64_18170 [Chloroflexia bacterium]
MFTHRVYTRRSEAYKLREEAASTATSTPHQDYLNNGEESEYRNAGNDLSYVANYSKGLPHNAFGEVNAPAYRAMLKALYSRNPDHFETIPVGRLNGRNLTNPQAGLAFDLEGADAQSVGIRPAPRIDSAENSAEMGELYWMALLRDVTFIDYGTGAGTDAVANNTAAAANSLSNDFTDFRGARDPATGLVTPATLFRGSPGDLTGPYISRFSLSQIPTRS